MPKMDGYEATKRIREACVELGLFQPYICACTGHTEPEYVSLAWASDLDELISKPAQPDTINQILSECVQFMF